jgi:hypothetical protein
MEQKYWLGRKRAAGAMARKATSAEARLIHFELAGRYSIRAAQSEAAPLFAPGPAAAEPMARPRETEGTRK